MATSPNPVTTTALPTASKPATPPPSIVSDIRTDLTWIKTHALVALLLSGMIAGGVYAGVSLVESLELKHDEHVAATQQKAEGVDTATQAALVAQLNADRTASDERDAREEAMIQSLVSQLKQQQAATEQQIAKDSILDAKDSAARLAQQTQASINDIVAQGDAVVMSLPVTHTVVAQLDQLPGLQSEVTNLQGQLTAQQVLTTDAKAQLDTANKIISADKDELLATVKADNAACAVKVDQQAAKDRKRGFWATVGGFVGGVLVGARL